MGVRLSIEIISPLEPEDRDLLTGLSIMTLAIANHEYPRAGREPARLIAQKGVGFGAVGVTRFSVATVPELAAHSCPSS